MVGVEDIKKVMSRGLEVLLEVHGKGKVNLGKWMYRSGVKCGLGWGGCFQSWISLWGRRDREILWHHIDGTSIQQWWQPIYRGLEQLGRSFGKDPWRIWHRKGQEQGKARVEHGFYVDKDGWRILKLGLARNTYDLILKYHNIKILYH